MEIDYALSEQEAGPGMTTPSDENPKPETPQTPPGNGPENPQTPPQTPPAAPQTPANPGTQGPSFAEVMNGLNALPEKIVHSLREAMQPATPPASQTPETKKTETSPAQSQQPAQAGGTTPGKKSFAEWWFGR